MSQGTPFIFIRDVPLSPRGGTPFLFTKDAALIARGGTPFLFIRNASPSPRGGTPFMWLKEAEIVPRGVKAAQIRQNTFDDTVAGRAPFGTNLFDVGTVNRAFSDQSIPGSKFTSGGITETQLSPSLPSAFIEGASLEIAADFLDIDYAETNYTPATTGIATDVNHLAAHLEGIDDAIGSLQTTTSTPTADNKDMVASVTVADEDQATASTVTTTPFNDSYIRVEVNGSNYVVGDSVKTDDCYFSNDSGTTARASTDIASGDTLHWNGTIAGFELDASDRIDFHYDT